MSKFFFLAWCWFGLTATFVILLAIFLAHKTTKPRKRKTAGRVGDWIDHGE